jgi:hypothetical protein
MIDLAVFTWVVLFQDHAAAQSSKRRMLVRLWAA